MQTVVYWKLHLESCTEVARVSMFLNFFKVKNYHDKDLYFFSLPPFKLPGLAKNILYVKYAILLALQGLTFACNDVSPHSSSSGPAVLMHCLLVYCGQYNTFSHSYLNVTVVVFWNCKQEIGGSSFLATNFG